jgi:hypothetical protein
MVSKDENTGKMWAINIRKIKEGVINGSREKEN